MISFPLLPSPRAIGCSGGTISHHIWLEYFDHCPFGRIWSSWLTRNAAHTDTAMMARVLPQTPDLETADETHNTWRIKDWRKLDRKVHGPTFECGGFPWCVLSDPSI